MHVYSIKYSKNLTFDLKKRIFHLLQLFEESHYQQYEQLLDELVDW